MLHSSGSVNTFADGVFVATIRRSSVGKVLLDVLPGLLLVLRVFCLATDIRFIAGQEKIGFREGP